MGSEKHIASLHDKHAELEQAIESENSRPLPDELLIQELKKQKLRIKDKIARITH